jgi:16S rRNA (cytidine1402-2'-O)-methyltransferase
MSGILYVVATPIGNLEDVTLRALRILREVALIAAEDTRRTSRLLQHYSISTPTTSLHEHNERRKSEHLIARLRAGESIALVSDAGTPLVSDPGAYLVSQAHAAGVRVEPVPGPNAAMAALSAAGFGDGPVHFVGFPPPRGSAREEWFATARSLTGVLLLYEAPHRIRDTLSDLLKTLGDRPMLLGRELTKTHETLVVRPIRQHLMALAEPRGEYTLVVTLPEPEPQIEALPSDRDLIAEFGRITQTGALTRRAALRMLAEKYGASVREVYARVERAKASGD